MSALGQFYGIGVGPGERGLIPVAAITALRAADVIFMPRAAHVTESLARQCLGDLAPPSARFREVSFRMDRDQSLLGDQYRTPARTISDELRAGRTVAYLTIGDPFTYSTYGYLLAALREVEPALRYRTFPGVTSFAATAAALSWPLGEGKERILILPCPDDLDTLKQDIETHDVVVLMKIGKRLPHVLDLLARLDLLEHCAFGHRVGLDGERLCAHLCDLQPTDLSGYLSTMLIRGRPRAKNTARH